MLGGSYFTEIFWYLVRSYTYTYKSQMSAAYPENWMSCSYFRKCSKISDKWWIIGIEKYYSSGLTKLIWWSIVYHNIICKKNRGLQVENKTFYWYRYFQLFFFYFFDFPVNFRCLDGFFNEMKVDNVFYRCFDW